MFTPQIYTDIELGRIHLNIPQPLLLGYRHQVDLHLDTCKGFTDAVSRAPGRGTSITIAEW
jgi:hypothetical protein